MTRRDWSNDEDVLAEGRKYSGRKAFHKGTKAAYRAALTRGLMDQLFPDARIANGVRRVTDEEVLAEGRKYATRREFEIGCRHRYDIARKRNLLDQLYPRTLHNWSNDEDVLAEGRKYSGRGAFMRGSSGAYRAACQRNLLDQLYPKQRRDWVLDEDVLAEGRKYNTRKDFAEASRAAYEAARQRGLLDLIEFPNNYSNLSDNDAIYIWRAVGQFYNGNPIYKIGVTSARLGNRRIVCVASDAGFEYDLICCEPVTCKATDLEHKLHLLGEDPQFTGFGGCTEFRALSDSALYAAITLICNVTKEQCK